MERLRYLIPVVSHTEQRPDIPPPVERPHVGLRWGRQARFDIAKHEALADNSGVRINWPDDDPPKFMRIIDVPVFELSQLVEIDEEKDQNVEVRRYLQMWFSFTEIRPKTRIGQTQPTRTTHCFFEFNLHPTNEQQNGN